MSELLIIAEHRRGELNPATLETISAAVSIKQADDTLAVAVIAQSPDDYVNALSVAAVDEIIKITTTEQEFQPDIYEAVTLELIKARAPKVVLLPNTINAWCFVPAVTVAAGTGCAVDVFGLRYEDGELVATRAAYNEKVLMEVDFPGKATVVMTIRTNTFKPPTDSATPQISTFDMPAATQRSQHENFIEPPATGDVDITQAEFLLSIGRGIGEEDNVEKFSQLADAMGFTLSCSRPLADSGWLPKSRQVGQSGKTAVACQIYIAMGISGAVQHLAGMKHIPVIIAVNADAESSIFSVAHYGIVGDILDIADELQTHFE